MTMLIALVLAASMPPPPVPPRISVAVRARIIRGTRIDLRNPARKPDAAILRKGLIEFP
jgi:hypothetical protein